MFVDCGPQITEHASETRVHLAELADHLPELHAHHSEFLGTRPVVLFTAPETAALRACGRTAKAAHAELVDQHILDYLINTVRKMHRAGR